MDALLSVAYKSSDLNFGVFLNLKKVRVFSLLCFFFLNSSGWLNGDASWIMVKKMERLEWRNNLKAFAILLSSFLPCPISVFNKFNSVQFNFNKFISIYTFTFTCSLLNKFNSLSCNEFSKFRLSSFLILSTQKQKEFELFLSPKGFMHFKHSYVGFQCSDS